MKTKLNTQALSADLLEGLLLLQNRINYESCNDGLKLTAEKRNYPGFIKTETEIKIFYNGKSSFYRELFLAVARKEKTLDYEEKNAFDTLSLMADQSRNAVMSVVGVKNLLNELALLGYTELQLYTEDTYEVENEPYFGYLRGRYSVAEIKEIDAYARKLGIELVPCIQTLAHLRSIYRWKTYYSAAFDCADVLLINSPRTKTLIENMFISVSKAFSSRKINVGMDEPFMLGRGKYLDKYGYRERDELYGEHLQFVKSLADKYGFKMQLWGDGITRRYFNEVKSGKPLTKLSDGVTVIHWQYGNCFGDLKEQLKDENMDVYGERIEALKTVSDNVRFAGAAYKFIGFAPNNAFSLYYNEKCISLAEKEGLRELMITLWGDCGCEAPVFSALPNIAYYAHRAYGRKDRQSFEEEFSLRYGSFSAFMSIDCANNLKPQYEFGYINSSAKYLLYQDTFLGCMDKSVEGKESEILKAYDAHIKELKKAEKVCTEYSYLFSTQIALVNALKRKFCLGVKTRAAYVNRDEKALTDLVKTEYPETIKAIKHFYVAFKKQWMTINKPHGIDVTDIRIGALIFRLQSNKQRIADFLSGNLSEIPELDEIILDEFGQGNKIIQQNWGEMTTPNTLIEYLNYV